jgi:hypothetical protein
MDSFSKIPKALIIIAAAIGIAVPLLYPPRLPIVVQFLHWLKNF